MRVSSGRSALFPRPSGAASLHIERARTDDESRKLRIMQQGGPLMPERPGNADRAHYQGVTVFGQSSGLYTELCEQGYANAVAQAGRKSYSERCIQSEAWKVSKGGKDDLLALCPNQSAFGAASGSKIFNIGLWILDRRTCKMARIGPSHVHIIVAVRSILVQIRREVRF